MAYISDLPPEVLQIIMSSLDPYSLCSLSRVSRSCHEVARETWLWDKFHTEQPLLLIAAAKHSLASILNLPSQVFSIEFDVGRSEKFPIICFTRKAASKSIPHLCTLMCRNDAESFAHELGSTLQDRIWRRREKRSRLKTSAEPLTLPLLSYEVFTIARADRGSIRFALVPSRAVRLGQKDLSRMDLLRSTKSKYSPELFLEWKLHTDGALDPVLGLYQSEEQDPPLLPKLLRSTLKIYPVEEGCILNTYRAVVNDVVYTLTGRPSNVQKNYYSALQQLCVLNIRSIGKTGLIDYRTNNNTFLEQCCTVLDVYDMLRSDVTRLCHMFVGSKYITDNDVAALDWAALRGPELAGVATQADVRLLLQLLICSQDMYRIDQETGKQVCCAPSCSAALRSLTAVVCQISTHLQSSPHTKRLPIVYAPIKSEISRLADYLDAHLFPEQTCIHRNSPDTGSHRLNSLVRSFKKASFGRKKSGEEREIAISPQPPVLTKLEIPEAGDCKPHSPQSLPAGRVSLIDRGMKLSKKLRTSFKKRTGSKKADPSFRAMATSASGPPAVEDEQMADLQPLKTRPLASAPRAETDGQRRIDLVRAALIELRNTGEGQQMLLRALLQHEAFRALQTCLTVYLSTD